MAAARDRSPQELIRAFENGEDRGALLYEARHLRTLTATDGFNDLVDRLLLSPSGEEVYEPCLTSEGIEVATYARNLAETGNDTILSLLIFDEEIAVIRARNDCDDPECTDVYFFPRLPAFEEYVKGLYSESADYRDIGAIPGPLGSDEGYERDEFNSLLPFYGPDDPMFRETVVPTRMDTFGSSTGFDVEKTADYMSFLADLFQGRLLVGWSGYVATDCYRNELFAQLEEHAWRGKVRYGLHPPGKDYFTDRPAFTAEDRELQAALRKMIIFLYRRVLDPTYNNPLPAPGTLRRARNWGERGPHVVRRALFDKRRATTGKRRAPLSKDAAFAKFLYASSPTPMFRLVLSFL